MHWPTNFGFDDLCEPQTKPTHPPPKKPKLSNPDKNSITDLTEDDSSVPSSQETKFQFKVPKASGKKNSSQVSWVDTYEPKSVSELVVHVKKVEEVENVLRTNPREKFVLLTGPSGSGKTVTLRCTCKKLNIGIKEWITSVSKTPEYDSVEFNDPGLYSSAVQEFEQFLVRSSRPRLTNNFSRDIVLVKDLPNVFYNDATLLHETLGKYESSLKSTLVFIMNDEQLIYKLFPSNVISQFKLVQVKFNPINDTGLIKTLQNILSKEHIPTSNDTLINIIQNCNGNLSYAINQLYFVTVLKEPIPSRQSKLTVKLLKESKEKGKHASSLDKNKQISYFQNIGRVLYPKKEPLPVNSFYQLKNPALAYKQKDLFRYKYAVTDLVQEFLTQPRSSVDVLQENYVSKYSNIKSLVESAVMFSNADQYASNSLSQNTTNSSISSEMYLHLVIGSLMRNENAVTSYAPVQRSTKHLLPDRNEQNKLVQDLFGAMFPGESSLNVLFDILAIVKGTNNWMNLEFDMNQVKFVHDFTFK
uniref:Cell cycle checkpoint protein RAD17 n=1 Tax=Cacopsylla melanoneura TaxID=428564 RepID=A0A8D8TWW1_9HEMI